MVSLSAHGVSAAYTIIETAEHDPSLYTQGLIVDGNDLVESSGRYGRSKIIRYNAATGKEIHQASFPASIFAEGLEQHNESLYLLTWKENIAFRLHPDTFAVLQKFKLETEGWGLTHNGEHFIQSDGSAWLYFRNSKTFKVEKKMIVQGDMRYWRNLNELEYAKGLIWANVYMTPTILAISPDGRVAYTLDLSAITAKHRSNDSNQVLNGIAYDPERDAFWVTGKYWNKRYLIRVTPPETIDAQ